MPADINRVDLLIQYALLVAGENDEWVERQLGPIHLIKYVYLGDLAYARRNQGNTFTGTEWQFYKFGPWSQEINARVQPALLSIGAESNTFESDYEGKDDWVRWSVRNDDLLNDKECALPPAITTYLRSDIRKFGRDTPSLLDHVYRTAPMLNASPLEYLDFSTIVDQAAPPSITSAPLRMAALSAKKKKQFSEGIRALQAEQKARASRSERLVNPVKSPRYDRIYQEGIEWLDTLAGERLQPGEKVAQFTDEVWKSQSRKGGDVS
jgi:hypothetical protein